MVSLVSWWCLAGVFVVSRSSLGGLSVVSWSCLGGRALVVSACAVPSTCLFVSRLKAI